MGLRARLCVGGGCAHTETGACPRDLTACADREAKEHQPQGRGRESRPRRVMGCTEILVLPLHGSYATGSPREVQRRSKLWLSVSKGMSSAGPTRLAQSQAQKP